MKKQLSALVISSIIFTVSAQADDAPIMFSSIDGFNAPNSTSVKGVNLSALHGHVDQLQGVNFSLLGLSETDTTVGLNVDLFFGIHKVNNNMTGLSVGIFNWMPGKTTGANVAPLNLTGDVHGANLGLINYSKGNTVVDIALGSISEKSTVQLGVFNMTSKIEGFQLGLINCADNGFLPCFPIINFGI